MSGSECVNILSDSQAVFPVQGIQKKKKRKKREGWSFLFIKLVFTHKLEFYVWNIASVISVNVPFKRITCFDIS
jgi:hypothetical protein